MNGLVNLFNGFVNTVSGCIPPPKIKENVFVDAEKLEGLVDAGIYRLPDNIFKQQNYVIGLPVVHIGSSMYVRVAENSVSYLIIPLDELIAFLKKKYNANFIVRPLMDNNKCYFVNIHMVV